MNNKHNHRDYNKYKMSTGGGSFQGPSGSGFVIIVIVIIFLLFFILSNAS